MNQKAGLRSSVVMNRNKNNSNTPNTGRGGKSVLEGNRRLEPRVLRVIFKIVI